MKLKSFQSFNKLLLCLRIIFLFHLSFQIFMLCQSSYTFITQDPSLSFIINFYHEPPQCRKSFIYIEQNLLRCFVKTISLFIERR